MIRSRGWLLASLAACFVLACVYAWLALPWRRKPVPMLPQAPKSEPFQVLAFDLAAPPLDETATLSVPARRRLQLRMVNRAPAVSYVWSLASPYYDSGPMVKRPVQILERLNPVPPACDPLKSRWRA